MPQETKAIIWNITDDKHRNALMLAVAHNPNAIPTILNAISEIAAENQVNIFTIPLGQRITCVDYIAKYVPEQIDSLLHYLEKRPLASQKKIIHASSAFHGDNKQLNVQEKLFEKCH